MFLRLPFEKINVKGTLLALFTEACDTGFKTGKSPDQIISEFWDEYCEHDSDVEKRNLLSYFIRYIERQVVLFDSIEDALFD